MASGVIARASSAAASISPRFAGGWSSLTRIDVGAGSDQAADRRSLAGTVWPFEKRANSLPERISAGSRSPVTAEYAARKSAMPAVP